MYETVIQDIQRGLNLRGLALAGVTLELRQQMAWYHDGAQGLVQRPNDQIIATLPDGQVLSFGAGLAAANPDVTATEIAAAMGTPTMTQTNYGPGYGVNGVAIQQPPPGSPNYGTAPAGSIPAPVAGVPAVPSAVLAPGGVSNNGGSIINTGGGAVAGRTTPAPGTPPGTPPGTATGTDWTTLLLVIIAAVLFVRSMD